MVSLGKQISDVKLIRKILRSLPERFRIKVTTIEESKDLEEMEIEELVGSLQTYEYSLPPVRKVKTIVLKASKASKKKSRVSSDEDSDIDAVEMLAKNFEHFMKNNKFKKFSDRLMKAPHTTDTEVAEKKDLRGPQCFEWSGFGHIRTDCANLKKQRGKAFNATLSEESEKEEETPEEEKFLDFVAPYEDKEDSQSYYFENSEEEDMQSTYQLQYVEFLKLRENYKQHVLKLNSLRTEKTSMLIKINDLEDRLLETQLQLERVSDEKLTHMLSIQKCPPYKTELGYVPPFIYDTPSTSKTIFVKPVIPESPPPRVDKGKAVMEREVPIIPQPPAELPIRRKPLTCHHCGEPGHIRPNCPHRQIQRKKKWQAPKTPMCHKCVLAIMSDLSVLHLSHPSSIYLRLEIMFQSISNCRSLLKQKRLGFPRSCIWKKRRLQERKSLMKEHLPSVPSCKI